MKLAFRIVFVTLFLFYSLGFADSVKQVKPMTYEQESKFIATYKSWLQKNGKDFRPALVWAAAEGEKWFVEMLLQHNEKIDEEEKAGGNALSAAILNKQEEIVELLLSKGADPNKTYANQMKGAKPIILAAQVGNTKILTCLIQARADVNYVVPDKYQTTPLYTALFHNQLEAAEVLIKSGAVFRPYRYSDGTIPERVKNHACTLKRVYEETFKEVQCK
jgi:hypothetical protein